MKVHLWDVAECRVPWEKRGSHTDPTQIPATGKVIKDMKRKLRVNYTSF